MDGDTVSRRELIRMAAGLLAAPVLTTCGATGTAAERLAVPAPVRGDRLAPGWHTLGAGGERDGVV